MARLDEATQYEEKGLKSGHKNSEAPSLLFLGVPQKSVANNHSIYTKDFRADPCRLHDCHVSLCELLQALLS